MDENNSTTSSSKRTGSAGIGGTDINNHMYWADRFKPQTLDEIAGHSNYVALLKSFIQKRVFPDLLLYGPSGSSKSTAVHCYCQDLAKSFCYSNSGQTVVFKEINGSKDRTKDELIDKHVIPWIESHPMGSAITLTTTTKQIPDKSESLLVLVIEEADRLMPDAQTHLAQYMDSQQRRLQCIFLANDVSKISVAIKTRCVPDMLFPRLDMAVIQRQLGIILEKTGNRPWSSEAIENLVQNCERDIRLCINTLQSVCCLLTDHHPRNNNNNNNNSSNHQKRSDLDRDILMVVGTHRENVAEEETTADTEIVEWGEVEDYLAVTPRVHVLQSLQEFQKLTLWKKPESAAVSVSVDSASSEKSHEKSDRQIMKVIERHWMKWFASPDEVVVLMHQILFKDWYESAENVGLTPEFRNRFVKALCMEASIQGDLAVRCSTLAARSWIVLSHQMLKMLKILIKSEANDPF